jgi:cell wall-associated NlpC family hydrolase
VLPKRTAPLPQPTEVLRLAFALLPVALSAQGRQVEFHIGRWYGDNPSATYEIRTTTALGGVLTHGLSATALVSDTLGRRRAFYGLGYEIQALRRRRTTGAYALAGAALGLSTDTSSQKFAAQWSIGGGAEWQPVSWFALGVEARYRLEDRGPRGFWRPGTDARNGVSGALGVSIGLGKGRGGRGHSGTVEALPIEAPSAITGNAADVVRTALDALGTPYRWGGTAENGFDCSGLIQYAYGLHGIRLPRRSRDQATHGAEVAPVVDALRPGDILLFSNRPGAGVTHVGMYVGDLKFIHSANDGVKLSLLEPHDAQGAYWMTRWVGARRIIP